MTQESLQIRTDVTKRLLMAFRYLFINGIATNKADFSKTIGLCPQNFHKLEDGGLYCTIENAFLLNREYGISLDWLFSGAGEMTTQQ